MATFYVFDKETEGTAQSDIELVRGGCGGCRGCGGCGGCHAAVGCGGWGHNSRTRRIMITRIAPVSDPST